MDFSIFKDYPKENIVTLIFDNNYHFSVSFQAYF